MELHQLLQIQVSNFREPIQKHGIKPLIQTRIKILLLFTFTSLLSVAQQKEVVSNAAFAEKIYLQLDSKIYTTDQTIWFKAIVASASAHIPTKLSGVLYMDLIGPQEKVIEKKIIKLKDGIGNGFFDLKPEYIEGQYLVRAYTAWNKNFEDDFIFKEYIQVFQTSEKAKINPISNITIIDTPDRLRRLNASFDPAQIDSLHKKDLGLIISLDKKKDTLTIRKNRDGKYLLDYVVPNDCNFVNLQMQTSNNFTCSKTVVLDEDYLDLQFFPESGELVHGLPAKVGLKAIGYDGKGKVVEGEIFNRQRKVVATFKSNQLGMGCFTLTNVDSAETYVARVKSRLETKPPLMFPLPQVAYKGNIISVTKSGNDIKVMALSNYQKDDSVYIQISCRGVVYFNVKEHLKKGKRLFLFSATDLPEGVIAVTMLDCNAHPLAERLLFNERPETRLNISLSTDKPSYLQRDSLLLHIETTNKTGKPVNSNLSVLVINKDEMGKIQDSRQNILTYFLLSSDLKGVIETPFYYFSKDNNRQADLDYLLLTQGWRKYLYTKPVDKFVFQPEKGLSVSGTVSSLLSQKKKKNDIDLVMMTFGENRYAQTGKSDSLGRFKFNLPDAYGTDQNILIQSTNNEGKQKDYAIELDKKDIPRISFIRDISVEKPDSVIHKLVERNVVRQNINTKFKLSSGDILLHEVTIESYRMTPQRKKVADEYSKPTTVIEGKDIQKKEEKWSYGLYSVLLHNYGDKVNIIRTRQGFLYAQVGHLLTLVVIDGIPVLYWDYPIIPNIPPSEVRSFEIIEQAKNFCNLFLKTFPEANLMDCPPYGGNIIAIYTNAGNGLFGACATKGLTKALVPAFSESREFYAPKYENMRPEEWIKPDLRALIHWQPQIVTDSLGKAQTSFYNADNLGKVQIVVEAISENGEIGYQELFYEVTKNLKNKQSNDFNRNQTTIQH